MISVTENFYNIFAAMTCITAVVVIVRLLAGRKIDRGAWLVILVVNVVTDGFTQQVWDAGVKHWFYPTVGWTAAILALISLYCYITSVTTIPWPWRDKQEKPV